MRSTIGFSLGCVSAVSSALLKRNKSAAIATVLVAALGIAPAFAQAPSEWTHLTSTPAAKAGAERWIQPTKGELFQLETALLRGKLSTAARGEPSAAKASGQEIQIPMPDGTFARFAIVEAPVMEDGLAAQFPDVKTYAGQGIDDPSATVRLDLTPAGFHAQILSPNGTVYVDPAYRGDANLHVSYFKRDDVKGTNDWACLTEGGAVANKIGAESTVTAGKVQSGATLRTYRLAVAATAEYTAFHSTLGTTNAAAGQAAIVTAINRVDGVYESELAVRLVLVANNNLLVYTNIDTDPYSNTDPNSLLSQNQSNIDAVIGSGNYDVGHVFSTGGGGLAGLGVVCSASNKARGETGLSAPTGDGYWIDYVAHELGHQFGANHTFNAVTGSCSGNRNAATAFEPGSGLTIMAYAGICPPNDLQPHSDPYFHGGSLDEIQTFLAGSGGGCAATSATGNTAPTVSVVGPTNYTIPASTPFVLTATASDVNGDTLSYYWEEMDAGAAAALTDIDNGSMALFRNFLPTNVPYRFFPKLTSILANTNWNQEKLPTTSRTMKFRVTARDNRSGGGGVSDASMTVASVAGTGPFVVTSPNTATNWSGTRTVTWNVAGSASAPINATGVNIYLSTDGGLTFPYLLVTNVPNNGSANVLLPNVTTSQARIKVEGSGNIFFDISDANFSVSPSANVPFIQLVGTSLISESCTPTNGAVDPYETVTFNWILSNSGGAPTTNLLATLLTSNGVYYPSPAQSLGVIPVGGSVTQALSFTPSGACGGSVTALLKLTDGAADMGTLSNIIPLGVTQVTVVTQTFANAGTISIPSGGTATPYPSTLVVSGVTPTFSKVSVNFPALWHNYAQDVGALLVGPNSQTVRLMNGTGGSSILSGVSLTFDDNAAEFLPQYTQIVSGTYLPTTYFLDYDFPTPAPTLPYGTSLSATAIIPNGTWSLYVYDFTTPDGGALTNGWKITFVSSNSTPVCCSTFPAPTLTSTTYSNNAVLFNWSAIPGPHYQVQYSTNLATGPWQNLGSSILATNTLMGITDSVGSSPMRFYRVLVGP